MTAKRQDLVCTVVPVGPLACNCVIIADPKGSKEAVVIDAGGDAELILETVRKLGCEIKQIYHTHAHFDHILASGDLKKGSSEALITDTTQSTCNETKLDPKLYLHKDDK
ncbi:hypothetical protein HK102_007948, partial [Quaeritorhiza haematococci]